MTAVPFPGIVEGAEEEEETAEAAKKQGTKIEMESTPQGIHIGVGILPPQMGKQQPLRFHHKKWFGQQNWVAACGTTRGFY